MEKILVINCSTDQIQYAMLEDKRLTYYTHFYTGKEYLFGDFYVGKVKKIMPSLNAAFLEIGFEKTAFLHFSDLTPSIKNKLSFTQHYLQKNSHKQPLAFFNKDQNYNPQDKIGQILSGKPEIVVQISKEAIMQKGPRLTCNFSIPGRFLVLSPFENDISISKKIISKDEKSRLVSIIKPIKPEYFGVIVRTAALNKSSQELEDDLKACLNIWQQIENNLWKSHSSKKLYSEHNPSEAVLRELFSPEFSKIIVNDNSVFQNVCEYIEYIEPSKKNIVQLYKGQGNIFDTFNVSRQLQILFNKKVILDNGAYLILEPTEALFVIDVNSGTNVTSNNQEQNSFNNNMAACEEIARQLKLRDIGGIIVIDFIDMKLPEHKKMVQDRLTELMHTDKAEHKIGTISKFGVLQLTRERIKPLKEFISEGNCWACEGTGKISTQKSIEAEIETKLAFYSQQSYKKITLEVHPIIKLYLTNGILNNHLKTFSKKFNIQLKIKSNDQINLIHYNFYNEFDQIIQE